MNADLILQNIAHIAASAAALFYVFFAKSDNRGNENVNTAILFLILAYIIRIYARI
jgi:hypothetical protein